MIKKGYKLSHEFPNESFIQEQLEEYFIQLGYSVVPEKPIDLKCVHRTNNETWIIEVKGRTTQIGLDFKTCLGQLLMRMDNPEYKYAIAMPDIIGYHQQINKVPKTVLKQLNLYWFLISQDGMVTLISNT
ncbi:hypothetical protein [Klebsiella sp. 2019SCSN059]|uniref:hypothetical protein n=1 Tax=Klebsiella sp. 2019SCSN059 TaxID=2911173 RepID=UPI001CF17E5B|nr:hypothetical protein [Klebsiella sp. 2019SCSN059]MCB3515930.1 hypothetical protein [Klebsiella pneumoniae]MCB3642893.1 hypothetical protein [Klebsiella pneumoniae]MCF8600606.1 hypothetical protein [Klebsiella sp. 2019SCSN059]